MSSSNRSRLLVDTGNNDNSSNEISMEYQIDSSSNASSNNYLIFIRRHRRAIIIMSIIAILSIIAVILSMYLSSRVDDNDHPHQPITPIIPTYQPTHIDCDLTLISPATCLKLYLSHYSLTGYIIPSSDAHQSEYVAACDQRRAYLTNFTGSAGTALVVNYNNLKNRVWTDSRYYIQIQQQLNLSEWAWNTPGTATQNSWITQNLPKNSIIGIDPALISAASFKSQQSSLAASGITLVSIPFNLVDLVWNGNGRPPPPSTPIQILDLKYVGEPIDSKITRVRSLMRAASRCRVLIVSALDNIGWLLNLRGRDIEYNPVFISYLVLTFDTITLYIDTNKTQSSNVQQYLLNHSIIVKHYDSFMSDLPAIDSSLTQNNGRVWLSSASQAIASSFTTTNIYEASSPIIYLQAVKNPVEVASMRYAHAKDGAAFVMFFDWLNRTVLNNTYVDECIVSEQIDKFRELFPDFVEPSYATIAGSGPNGAIVHYEPEAPNCAQVNQSQILLVDSGGQWLDGTTDTTRTIHLGESTLFERHTFTRVLQGHIDQMNVIWQSGTSPVDWSARQPLLRDGLTYGHGTSHGVGEFLNVHESIGGAQIAGVITSIEPGYYHIADNNTMKNHFYPGYDKGFGIRIESDAVVTEWTTILNNQTKYFTYQPIAFVPIQSSLIRTSLMSDLQIDWLNNYHQRCKTILTPLLINYTSALEWLNLNTQSIVKRNDD